MSQFVIDSPVATCICLKTICILLEMLVPISFSFWQNMQ